MTAVSGLWGELRSLHDELSASRRQHSSPSADQAAASERTVALASQPKDSDDKADAPLPREELHGLINLITKFVEDAEKNVSEHPMANVVGALVVGILIGRLLGRR